MLYASTRNVFKTDCYIERMMTMKELNKNATQEAGPSVSAYGICICTCWCLIFTEKRLDDSYGVKNYVKN